MKKNTQSFNNNMVGSKKKVTEANSTKKQNSKVGYNLTDTDESSVDSTTDSSITDCSK